MNWFAVVCGVLQYGAAAVALAHADRRMAIFWMCVGTANICVGSK